VEHEKESARWTQRGISDSNLLELYRRCSGQDAVSYCRDLNGRHGSDRYRVGVPEYNPQPNPPCCKAHAHGVPQRWKPITTNRFGGATGAGVPCPVQPKSQTQRRSTANPAPTEKATRIYWRPQFCCRPTLNALSRNSHTLFDCLATTTTIDCSFFSPESQVLNMG
jgi:hypothetical protein